MARSRNILLECYEGETPRITGTLYDHEDELVPDDLIQDVLVRVYDYNSGTTLREPESIVTASSSWEIWLTETETTLYDQTLPYEDKIVICLATYLSGSDVRHANTEGVVRVKNMDVYRP
jgi:hypothetical protein